MEGRFYLAFILHCTKKNSSVFIDVYSAFAKTNIVEGFNSEDSELCLESFLHEYGLKIIGNDKIPF